MRRYSGQNERRDTGRTFVHAAADGSVLAYYTLVATELQPSQSTVAAAHRVSPQYPIPAALIARLAVDKSVQGRGLGAALLLDGLRRMTVAAEQVAVRAVVVDAIDRRAAAFYEQFGFQEVSGSPLRLQVTVDVVRRVLG